VADARTFHLLEAFKCTYMQQQQQHHHQIIVNNGPPATAPPAAAATVPLLLPCGIRRTVGSLSSSSLTAMTQDIIVDKTETSSSLSMLCAMFTLNLKIQACFSTIHYIHGSIGEYIKNAAGMTFRSVGPYSRTSPVHD
jgi:hypothetical protein